MVLKSLDVGGQQVYHHEVLYTAFPEFHNWRGVFKYGLDGV